ncbi:snake venom 5'-nucleotidase-like isoform X3 [Daphnia pulicaria]|nr:snake venom 5'-nucleotidase-like isoform X3 [Daphnia pulicaria]XP_046636635.1 snake venom 5'-nucleotidase-like isoform X3 [Daphnia pulicaria]XP_046636636.1 snake venom 5'-nucleotidase-like isoform X3 [Daphnia pulicaria]
MASITLLTPMMMMCLWLFVVSVWATPIPSSSEQPPPVHQPSDSTSFFNLTVLHINDIHCRFEEANKFGGSCTPQESAAGKCFGGYARLVHQSRVIREENPNTIFLAAGDFFQGTIWYTIHKWKAVSRFGNLLNLTAMSLGNHEFDDGVDGLLPFVEAANHPVMAANIDTSGEPRLDGKIPKSKVVQVDGRKVGIIGYLTPETSYMSSTDGVRIFDEVEGVRQEAERLKKEGVNILIAVGHAGYHKDMQIAEQVPDIDLVVGGHTNTFLWNGPAPSSEEPTGSYPTLVKQPSGRSVPVVQAFAFGKYLGNLMMTFNDDGEVIATAGLPILMDKSVPRDPHVVQELIPYREEVEALAEKEVGKTLVFLNGSRLACRLAECNLGSFIADAYVNLFTKFAGPGQWSKVSIALLNSGAIRSSVDERSRNGSITYGNILSVAPFPNTVDVVKINGETLKKMLEYSVQDYNASNDDPLGGFLQVSGINVVYDVSRPKGDRVVQLLARCNNCRMPVYLPVEPEEVYDVAMSSYLAGGGDGYKLLKGNIIEHTLTGMLDADTIITYMAKMSPIVAGLDRRISFVNNDTSYRSLCSQIRDGDEIETSGSMSSTLGFASSTVNPTVLATITSPITGDADSTLQDPASTFTVPPLPSAITAAM